MASTCCCGLPALSFSLLRRSDAAEVCLPGVASGLAQTYIELEPETHFSRGESMRLCRFTRPSRMIVGLTIVGLLTGLLLAMAAVPLSAQERESHPGRGFNAPYDAAHEITVNGTVQEVVTRHALGTAPGMHLLVSGTDGVVDAHVGSFLSEETRAAMHEGLPIQIVGAMQELHGKQFLLARQITFGGRMVTVRSRTGFLVRELHRPRRESPTSQKAAGSETNGGSR